MSDLQKKIKKIISDIEENIQNKDDLEYIKNQICNIYNIFMDELDTLEDKSTKKMESLLIRYKVLEDRMSDIEKSIDKIETDIYINDDDNNDYTFDITCPYCDTEFSVDYSDELKRSVICPECNNTIELDWNDNEGCSHGCCGCNEDCSEKQKDEDKEDDM